MNKKQLINNELLNYLYEQGVPIKSLPKLIKTVPADLPEIMIGRKKVGRDAIHICVCNSGHDVYKKLGWNHSGWNIRVKGKKTLFFKGDYVFDISQIPVFLDTIFVVSLRAKKSEPARIRADLLFFTSNRAELGKSKIPT
jgi:hypothetical protein